jgi:hypothetical protein
MSHTEIRSRVGADGILTVCLPLGPEDANREVLVTVEPVKDSSPPAFQSPKQWQEFVNRMAGCITDPTFQRSDQGQYEDRGNAFA